MLPDKTNRTKAIANSLRFLTREFKTIEKISKGSTFDRQIYADKFTRLFCQLHRLAYAKTVVYAQPRPPADSEGDYLYGEYKCKTVYIYNLTPKRKQPTTFDVFLDTLIHELTHHRDQAVYGITAEHDNKFYTRVDGLKAWVTS